MSGLMRDPVHLCLEEIAKTGDHPPHGGVRDQSIDHTAFKTPMRNVRTFYKAMPDNPDALLRLDTEGTSNPLFHIHDTF